MSGGPDVVQDPTISPFPFLGASTRDEVDLGPISPELALVDQVLAGRARTLLPDPREPPRLQQAPAAAEPSPPARMPVVRRPAPPPATRSTTRQLARLVALSAIVFAAGAASAELLGRRDPAPTSRLLEVRPPTADEPRTRESAPSLDRRTTRSRPEAARSPGESRSNRPQLSAQSRERRPRAPITWAANVLGVTAAVDARGVRLEWRPPADSDRVVVYRTLEDGNDRVTLFRGRATSVRDDSPLPCRTYRYTIVNYDRGGHRSTGVPTSVVTGGCT